MVIQLPPPASNRGDLKTKTHTESRVQSSGRDSNAVPLQSTKASSRRDAYDESRYSQVQASDAGTARSASSERHQTTRKAGDRSETAKTSTRRDDESRARQSTTRDPHDSVKTGDSTKPPNCSGSVRDSTHVTRDIESKRASAPRPPQESTRARKSHVPPSRTQSVKDSGSHAHSTVRDPYDSVRTGGASSKSRIETAKKPEDRPAASRRLETIIEDQQSTHSKTHNGSSVSRARADHGSTRHTSKFDDRSAVPSRSSTVRESSRSTIRPTHRTSKHDDRSAVPSRSSTVRESSRSTARPTDYALDSRRESHSNAHAASERHHELPGALSRRNTVKESSRQQTLAPYDSRGRDSNYSGSARIADDLSQLALNSNYDRQSRSRGGQSMAMVPHQDTQRVKIPDGCVDRAGRLNQKARLRLFDAVVVLDLKTEGDWHALINIVEQGELKSGELVKFAKWGKKNSIFEDAFSGTFANRDLLDFGDSDDESSDDDDDDYRLRRKDRGARYSYYEKITIERVRYRKRK